MLCCRCWKLELANIEMFVKGEYRIENFSSALPQILKYFWQAISNFTTFLSNIFFAVNLKFSFYIEQASRPSVSNGTACSHYIHLLMPKPGQAQIFLVLFSPSCLNCSQHEECDSLHDTRRSNILMWLYRPWGRVLTFLWGENRELRI